MNAPRWAWVAVDVAAILVAIILAVEEHITVHIH